MIYGVTGLGMHVGGGISLDAAHDFTACGPQSDPFAPDLMVLRQVEPTPKPLRGGAAG